MSAKWRALQHRHRYTYSSVVFPHSYIESLNLLPSDISSLKFFTELKELISLNSIYSQVDNVKKVSSAFGELFGNSGDSLISVASRFYLEILFLENSLPLHRTLVSVLVKCRNFQSVIGSCFRILCDEYGVQGGKGRRFSLCRVALSLMGCPKLGFLAHVVEECSNLIALDASFGLNAVVSETLSGSRPSPIVMEQCQEALSCLYYLLQRFPLKFADTSSCKDVLISKESTVFEIVVGTILSILKSSAFSRDCLVAAGVSFCAALQACINPEELAPFIVKVFFRHTNCSISCCISKFSDKSFKIPYKEDFYSEMGDVSMYSRLCLLRGILTAIPRTVLNTLFTYSRDLDAFNVNGSSSSLIWTILFDGILLELCNYCEDPIDSHFNFHVLTVMQICLQQIKTSILADLVTLSENYDPISEDVGARILRIIWNNLEDPLNQTVKQVHLIFDLLLDIQSTLKLAKGSERKRTFLQKTALDLLRLGARCKGRYVPLASLTKRLGAKTILDMRPNLLFEAVYAYVDDDVCCAVTSFLKCFLECLRDECWSSDGIESGYVIFRGHCLPPVLYGLVSGVSKLRSNLNTYALPVVLEVDVDSIFPMLAFISVGQIVEDSEVIYPELSGANMVLRIDQKVAALVSLLKVSRFLALIEGDIDWYHNSLMLQEECGLKTEDAAIFALVCVKGIKVKVPVEWLVLALTHVDETLRIDAAESLFLNPKTSSLPSPLELSLMKEAIPLNMRCCSTAFQMKWTSLFRKFFSRVRTALERQLKQERWQPLGCSDNNKVGQHKGGKETVAHRAEDLFHFMKWLSCFLFFSCYPSAPYERKIMAMELMLIMINVWPVVPYSQNKCDSTLPPNSLCPYSEGFTLPDSTLLLVGSIIDSWDRLRESAFRILLHFPTPLPGISSQNAVKEVVAWAKRLVCSPRVRESDAGALTLRLTFRKYVLELGWTVGASVNIVCFNSPSNQSSGDSEICERRPVLEYILSLVNWLRIAVEEGEKDLSEACKNSFVHGVLLTLRYTFEELDWNSDVVLSSSSETRHVLENLLELVMRITSLALWVVSADAWYLPEDMDDMVDDDGFLSDAPVEMNGVESSSEHQVKSSRHMTSARPSEQVVMVGCWLAMKEVSLLLGTIIRKIPLPRSTCLDLSKPGELLCEATDVILDVKQLETIGNHFLEVLLKMKHNGAIDKTRAGFTALCNRLLCSNDPRLCKMTESWMEQLMERTVAKGQTVDDLLRRSAGIPAAFIALFLSEPEGTPKKLLPRALRWLIDVANMSFPIPTKANNQNGDLYTHLSQENQEPLCAQPTHVDLNQKNSKIRDEGVIPTVHAFNVLRASFNDTNLATDTSGFCAEALIIAIRSFSSPYWEVRNSACLAYTALVRRMIGFLNVQKRESARRALTGLEFFHRYPILHPFFFSELKVATEFLGDGSCSESNMAKVVHPSLCPMLILLSRLKPSTISSETEDGLDPFLFMPFIRKCSTQSNLRVRVLASRALTGLVSNEKLPSVLINIALELPHNRNGMSSRSASSSSTNGGYHTHVTSFNSIHGMLLHLGSLLDNNCRNLTDVSKKEEILGDLIELLKTSSWIGSPKLCPCPILNSSYLQVLDHMLSIARRCGIRKHEGSICNILLELSLICLNADVSQMVPFYDPTKTELHKQASTSYFNCVFQASNEAPEEDFQMPHIFSHPALDLFKVPETEPAIAELQERLILSISDALYEVRLASLKWLLLFLKSTAYSGDNDLSGSGIHIIYHWAKTSLQPTMMQLLDREENPRCTCYLLRILFLWNLIQFEKSGKHQYMESVYVGVMDFASLFEFWNKLILLNKVATHTKTREALIRCMGICAKRFSCLFMTSVFSDLGGKKIFDPSNLDQSDSWNHIYRCIRFFIDLIKQYSASSEPVNMRKAAAESIVASGLLEEASCISSFISNTQIPSEENHACFDPSEAVNTYGRTLLDLWFTCIRLLEDEDVGLRQRLAFDVQKCFTPKESGKSHQTGFVPTQVEKVIESSFDFLSSVFGHWFQYFDYLSRWVMDTGSCTVTSRDLVRRIFDKEIDNHHEEKLLICQLCCFHLEKLPVFMVGDPSYKHEVRNFLQNWRMRFYHQLISCSGDYLPIEGGIDWIGGVGNHKDSFIPIYANMLGFYALSRCLYGGEFEVGDPLLPNLVELGEKIRPFLRNPLISNLYLFLIQSHEKMLGVAMGNSGPKSYSEFTFTWEGFNPYFLLK